MSIQYKKLGNSGLYIAPILVGCMSYGTRSWQKWVVEDEEEIMTILKKCYDSGLRTFDTANMYSFGLSETLLGKFLKKFEIPRENVVILSKCYFSTEITANNRVLDKENWKYANKEGLSRKHILDAVSKSVERLGTYIDVLQIHRMDRTTPQEETMRALNDLVSQGLTRYIGASTMRASEFAQLQFIAEKHGWSKFISMQNYYNLLYREEEREMIPFCKDNIFGEVGLIPWSPIAKGKLARPFESAAESERSQVDPFFNTLSGACDEEIVNRVEELSKKYGVSMASLSTAWTIAKGCAPIVGLNSVKRVDDILTALTVKLTEEDIKYLEEPYQPKPQML